MARYTITYTETLGTSFDVETPDGLSEDEMQTWVDDHWNGAIEPNIQTHMLEQLGSDLDWTPRGECDECGGDAALRCRYCADGHHMCAAHSHECAACGGTCCDGCAHGDGTRTFCPLHRCDDLDCAECDAYQASRKRR